MDQANATQLSEPLKVYPLGGDGFPDTAARRTSSGVTRLRPDSPQGRTPVDIPSGVFKRSYWQGGHVAKLRVTDFLVVLTAVNLAQLVRFGATSPLPTYPVYVVPTFTFLFAMAWLCALGGFRTRSPRLIGTGIDEYRRVIAASFWVFGAIAIVTLLLRIDIARGYLAVALPAGTAGLVVSRWLWHKSLVRKRVEGQCQIAVLAFGEREAISHLVDELTRDRAEGYSVVGIGITGYGPARGETLTINDREIPVVGDEMDMLDAIRTCGADTLAIAGTECLGVRGIRRLIWDLEPMGVDLVVSTGAMDVALSRLVMRPIAGLPMLHIEKPQYHGSKRYQKRAFDFCIALAVLILVSPFMALTALVIKATSKGPVFYASERIGIDGQPFSMLKFRTMVDDADRQLEELLKVNESDGLIFKIKSDPRVTPVGRFLRRYSIDELPQFINVLRCEMSVVGPRPPLRREVEAYDHDIIRRLLVKPGITGLWQVSGRSDLSWNEAVRLDLSYVDNWSMVGDFLIVLQTFAAVLLRRGAY